MSIFDELVARYRNMNYGNLSGNNPSAVRSLLEEYNDRTYAQTINPSELTYLNGVPQNQWIIDDRGNLVFGMPGMEERVLLLGVVRHCSGVKQAKQTQTNKLKQAQNRPSL